MNSEILAAVLTSTLFAALVTGFLNYIINNKKITTENIVIERKKWREMLREISLEINIAKSADELTIAISKLKVNINAYGQINSSNFMIDGHLWKLIRKFEDDEIDENKIIIYARGFTDMISALIKYDWDRTKTEIKGSSNIRGIIIANIVCMFLGFFTNIYIFIKDDLEISYSLLIELLLITVLVGVFCIYAYYIICKSTQYVFEIWKTEKVKNLKKAYIGLTGIIIFTIVDNSLNTGMVINDILGIQFRSTAKFQTAGMLLGGVISLIHIWELYKNRLNYWKVVSKIVSRTGSELTERSTGE